MRRFHPILWSLYFFQKCLDSDTLFIKFVCMHQHAGCEIKVQTFSFSLSRNVTNVLDAAELCVSGKGLFIFVHFGSVFRTVMDLYCVLY